MLQVTQVSEAVAMKTQTPQVRVEMMHELLCEELL